MKHYEKLAKEFAEKEILKVNAFAPEDAKLADAALKILRYNSERLFLAGYTAAVAEFRSEECKTFEDKNTPSGTGFELLWGPVFAEWLVRE